MVNVNYDHIHGFKTQQVCIQPKCTWPDKAALLHDVQSVLSHITPGSDSATLRILLQKCRSSRSYGKKKKRLKGTGKLYCAIDPNLLPPSFSTAKCKILQSLMFSFVDKFSLSVAL